MKRILITGGTGFIGGNLARRLLDEGHDVTILARGTDKMPCIPSGMKFVKCDITTDPIDVVNYDWIYHCASTVNDYNLLDGNTSDTTVNMIGTQRLLEAIRHDNPWTRLIFVSTFFVYGDQDEKVTEETPCRPKGIYGITKKAAEDMCQVYRKVFNLDIVIARLSNIYGVNQATASQKTAAFNWMVRSCVENKTISLYDNGDLIRDYMYIDDAVQGLYHTALYGTRGELYLLSAGESHLFRLMVDCMRDLADGGMIREVASPGFHQRVGIGDFYTDNAKAKKQLGWSPQVGIMEGIRRTVEYYESCNA